jgi:hypothetical protein
MTPSEKSDAVTGIVTVTLGVISGSFSAADFQAWGTTVMGLSPFVLILFLIWRMRQLDLQHKECTANQIKTQDQLVLAFRAIQDSQVRKNLPTEDEFCAGNFCLNNHTTKET